MDPREQLLRDHLRTLTADQLENLKSHADAADHQEHPSFQLLRTWLINLGILTAAAATAAFVWKAIKIIQKHED